MAKWTLTDEEILKQLEEADRATQLADQTEPHAVAARYDRSAGKFIVDLNNGTTFIFPAHVCQGLTQASEEELADVSISPSGGGLLWNRLDEGLTIGGLMRGIFGTKAWMAELGRRSKGKTSASKAKASRENGKKGGRPRKTAL